MARTFAVFTRAEAPTFQKLLLWLYDLPVEGVDVGAGRHETHDPKPTTKKQALGWVTRIVDPVRYPGNTGAATDQFAFAVTQDMRDRWQAKKAALTPAQQTWVTSHLTAAADLAADWTTKDPDGNDVLDTSEDVEPAP